MPVRVWRCVEGCISSKTGITKHSLGQNCIDFNLVSYSPESVRQSSLMKGSYEHTATAHEIEG